MQELLQINSFQQTPLFQGLHDDEIYSIQKMFVPLEIPSRRVIISVGQQSDHLLILTQGSVKVQLEHDNGNVVVVAVLGPGHVIGEMGTTDGQASSATVVSLEKCTFLSIDSIIFTKLRHELPRISDNLLRILTSRLRIANQQILALAIMNAEARIVHQLLALVHEFGVPDQQVGALKLPFRLSQVTLGEMTGLSRNRVNLVLKHLEKQCLLSRWGNGRLCINNLQALEQYALHIRSNRR